MSTSKQSKVNKIPGSCDGECLLFIRVRGSHKKQKVLIPVSFLFDTVLDSDCKQIYQ